MTVRELIEELTKEQAGVPLNLDADVEIKVDDFGNPESDLTTVAYVERLGARVIVHLAE